MAITYAKLNKALNIFNNPHKISAIGSICGKIARTEFDLVRERIRTDGIEFLQGFDFIGRITRYHLANNIGMDVVKPDRHLVRIANAAKYSCPSELCQAIADMTGDKLAVVDLVLWRYASLNVQYIDLFQIHG